jgi:hypothetical protein
MIAYLDCSTGVSGDKLLGALIDAGFDLMLLADALEALGLGSVRVVAEEQRSGGVSGIGVSVEEPDAPRRNWLELNDMLEAADLPAQVKDGAVHALSILAGAEAQVHGVEPEEVHFHEIGAADTIADILGVSLALHHLGVLDLVASPVAVGSGTVMTEHGELPVPAPATALLLRGMPLVPGAAVGELTTPTGAALLATFATAFGSIPPMTLRRVGTGCGTRDIGTPNICRLLVGEAELPEPGHEDVVVLETNIDHLTAEELAVAAERLREAGALDVWQTPVIMKKGRAGTVLSVLASTATAVGLADRVIAETGSLGVRVIPASRRLVERDVAEIETSLGTARFKVAILPTVGRVLRVESDDAARIAETHSMAVDAATRILEDEASRATGVQPMRQRASS